MENLQQKIEDAIKNAMVGLKSDIINEISENTASTLKRSVTDDIESTVTKKIKHNQKPEFWRKYNKDQYEHNSKVSQAIESVEEALDSGNITKAKEKLSEGKKIVKKRQNLFA